MSQDFALDPRNWPLITQLISEYGENWDQLSQQLKNRGITSDPKKIQYVWRNLIHESKPIDTIREQLNLMICGIYYEGNLNKMAEFLSNLYGQNRRLESQVKFHFIRLIKRALRQIAQIFTRKKLQNIKAIQELDIVHIQAFLRLRSIVSNFDFIKQVRNSTIIISRLLVLYVYNQNLDRANKYEIFSKEVKKCQVEKAIFDVIHCVKLQYRIVTKRNGKECSINKMLPQDSILMDYLSNYNEFQVEYPENIEVSRNLWQAEVQQLHEQLSKPKLNSTKFLVAEFGEERKKIQPISAKLRKLQNTQIIVQQDDDKLEVQLQ